MVHGRARCPWVQGQVERVNGTLKGMISSMVVNVKDPFQWTNVLEDIGYRYNCDIHSTTQNSPFKLFLNYSKSEKLVDSAIEDLLAILGDEENKDIDLLTSTNDDNKTNNNTS